MNNNTLPENDLVVQYERICEHLALYFTNKYFPKGRYHWNDDKVGTLLNIHNDDQLWKRFSVEDILDFLKNDYSFAEFNNYSKHYTAGWVNDEEVLSIRDYKLSLNNKNI